MRTYAHEYVKFFPIAHKSAETEGMSVSRATLPPFHAKFAGVCAGVCA